MWEVAGSLDAMHSINENTTGMELMNKKQMDTLNPQDYVVKGVLSSDSRKAGQDNPNTLVKFTNHGKWGGVFHRDLKLENLVLRVSDGKPNSSTSGWRDTTECMEVSAPTISLFSA